MRYLSLIMLIVTLGACQSDLPYRFDTSDISQEILHYGAKVKYEKHLHLADSVVYFDEYITKVRLDFTIQSIVEDLWDARELLVDTIEGFLTAVNENGNITPFLEFNELTYENLEVYICLTSFYGQYVDLQDSALITMRNGIANYFTFTATDCSQDCWNQRKEYYWQSKMFVQYHREGEEMYAPKPSPLKSVFGMERYLPPSK